MANTIPNKKVTPRKQAMLLRLALIVVLLVVVILVALSMLGGKDGGNGKLSLPPAGNRGDNLANGGTVMVNGNDVYLSDPVIHQICIVPAGQTTGSPVGDLKGQYMNTDGTSLWYVSQDTGELMKAGLDGSNPTVVVPKKVTRVVLSGDYLYYVDTESDYALSRIATADGSAPELLSGARVLQYAVVGGRIFYRDLNAADDCNYMALDGTDPRILSIRIGQTMFSQDGRMYFANPARNGAISYTQMKADGGFLSPVDLDTGTVTCAAADDTAVYYVKAQDGLLYKLPFAKGDTVPMEERLTDIPVYGLQIAGGNIYYQSVADGGTFGVVAKSN